MSDRPHVQLDEEVRDICQIPDEPAQRQRENNDQRRGRDDLVTSREVRLLVDVDDLEFHAAFQLPVA